MIDEQERRRILHHAPGSWRHSEPCRVQGVEDRSNSPMQTMVLAVELRASLSNHVVFGSASNNERQTLCSDLADAEDGKSFPKLLQLIASVESNVEWLA